jgi:hypothetical protein
MDNPLLHTPTKRLVMDFDGPTRGGLSSQTIDATMVDTQHTFMSGNNDNYCSSRNYVQYNVKQELQTFYKEIVSMTKMDDIVRGRLRVAAFLPDPGEHDDSQAVALYDYALNFRPLDEDGAASL